MNPSSWPDPDNVENTDAREVDRIDMSVISSNMGRNCFCHVTDTRTWVSNHESESNDPHTRAICNRLRDPAATVRRDAPPLAVVILDADGSDPRG